ILFRRFCPHDLKSLFVERDIRMCLSHHGLKLSHYLREEIWIAILSNVESLCRVMNIELCICGLLTFFWKESARKMVEFTTYFKSIRPTGTCDRMINVDPQRCESKCSIVLANVLAKGIRCRADTTEQVFESWRRRRKWRKIYLTLKTALAKFFVIEGGSCELFSIPMKSMAMLTLNIHTTKRMTSIWLFISLSSWRQILLSESFKILVQLSSLCSCLCSLCLCLCISLSLCLSSSFCSLLCNSGSNFSGMCLIICNGFYTVHLFLLSVNSLCLSFLFSLKLFSLLGQMLILF